MQIVAAFVVALGLCVGDPFFVDYSVSSAWWNGVATWSGVCVGAPDAPLAEASENSGCETLAHAADNPLTVYDGSTLGSLAEYVTRSRESVELLRAPAQPFTQLVQLLSHLDRYDLGPASLLIDGPLDDTETLISWLGYEPSADSSLEGASFFRSLAIPPRVRRPEVDIFSPSGQQLIREGRGIGLRAMIHGLPDAGTHALVWVNGVEQKRCTGSLLVECVVDGQEGLNIARLVVMNYGAVSATRLHTFHVDRTAAVLDFGLPLPGQTLVVDQSAVISFHVSAPLFDLHPSYNAECILFLEETRVKGYHLGRAEEDFELNLNFRSVGRFELTIHLRETWTAQSHTHVRNTRKSILIDVAELALRHYSPKGTTIDLGANQARCHSELIRGHSEWHCNVSSHHGLELKVRGHLVLDIQQIEGPLLTDGLALSPSARLWFRSLLAHVQSERNTRTTSNRPDYAVFGASSSDDQLAWLPLAVAYSIYRLHIQVQVVLIGQKDEFWADGRARTVLEQLERMEVPIVFLPDHRSNDAWRSPGTVGLARICTAAHSEIDNDANVMIMPNDLLPVEPRCAEQPWRMRAVAPRFRTTKRNCTTGMRQLFSIEEPQLRVPSQYTCATRSVWQSLLGNESHLLSLQQRIEQCVDRQFDWFDQLSTDGEHTGASGFDWLELGMGYRHVDGMVLTARLKALVAETLSSQKMDPSRRVPFDAFDTIIMFAYRDELSDRLFIDDENTHLFDPSDLGGVLDIQLIDRISLARLGMLVSTGLESAVTQQLHRYSLAAVDQPQRKCNWRLKHLSIDALFDQYCKCHHAITTRQVPARFLLFRWVTSAGWGNIFGQVTNYQTTQ